MEDVQRIAGEQGLAQFVDNALGLFYDHVMEEVARESQIPELEIRTWCEERLINPGDTRGLVPGGDLERAGLPRHAIALLEAKLLIHRAQVASGGLWYELIHDRFVRPIQASNLRWYKRQPLILQEARDWKESQENPAKLRVGPQLQEALDSNWHTLSPLVAEFIEAGRHAQEERQREAREAEQLLQVEHANALAAVEHRRAEAEHRARRHVQLLAACLGLAVLVALFFWQDAAQNARTAFDAQRRASENARSASNRLALLLMAEAETKRIEHPQRSLLLAAEAMRISIAANGLPLPEIITTTQKVIVGTAGMPLRAPEGAVVQIHDPLLVVASPSGRWLAAVAQSGTTYLWDLRADPERAVEQLAPAPAETDTTSLAAGDRWLVIGRADGTIEWLALADPSRPRSSPMLPAGGRALTALAVSPTSDLLAAGDQSGAVRLYDLRTPEAPARSILESGSPALQLVFSPGGEWLALVDADDTLQVWSLAGDGSVRQQVWSKNKNGLLAFSPAGAWLAIASEKSPMVQLLNLQDPDQIAFELVRTIQVGAQANVRCLAFSSDGANLVVGHDDGAVIVWTLPQPPPGAPSQPTILVDRDQATLIGQGNSVTALRLWQDGAWLGTGGADGTMLIWNMKAVPPSRDNTLYGHEGPIERILPGPADDTLVSVGGDGQIRYWSREESREVMKLGPDQLAGLAVRKAGRDFTDAERAALRLDREVQP